MGVLPSKEECSEGLIQSFASISFSWSLSSFGPILWFLFPHPIYPGTLPWVHTHPSANMDLEVKVSVRSKIHYGLALSLDFEPQGALLHMSGVSLVPKDGGVEIPLSFTQTRFCPSLSLS